MPKWSLYTFGSRDFILGYKYLTPLVSEDSYLLLLFVFSLVPSLFLRYILLINGLVKK